MFQCILIKVMAGVNADTAMCRYRQKLKIQIQIQLSIFNLIFSIVIRLLDKLNKKFDSIGAQI